MSITLPIPPHIGLKSCRHGVFTYFVNDMYIGKSLDHYGEYSEIEASFLMGLLKPGTVVIDVGANIGALTIPMARAVGPTGAVVAYEPQRTSFQMLCTNAALNGLFNIFTKQAAVGARSGSVTLPDIANVNSDNFGAILAREVPRQTMFTTPMIKLDDEEIGPNLIKIDVEGMEIDVLRGAVNMIEKYRPALYVENDWPDKSRDLVSLLIDYGYECHWHTPPMFNINNWRKQAYDLWPGVASFNMICIPKECKAQFADEAITVETAVHPALRGLSRVVVDRQVGAVA